MNWVGLDPPFLLWEHSIPLLMTDISAVVVTFWRNLEWYSFQRGWTNEKLAEQLGVSKNTLNRLRFGRCRYIDPEILVASLEVFELTPNDLLLSKPEVERRYANA